MPARTATLGMVLMLGDVVPGMLKFVRLLRYVAAGLCVLRLQISDHCAWSFVLSFAEA